MAIEDLPFEVWLNIACFIPAEELQSLYEVNHALFNIVMNKRYKTIKFEYHREIFRMVDILKNNPSAAQRVRTLILSSQIIPTLTCNDPYSSRLIRYKNIMARFVRKKPSLSVQATTDMLRILSGMKHLTEVGLIRSQCCLDLPDLISFLPIVKTGWATFGHNLQRLVLDITLEGCALVLSQPLTFPRLEYLKFGISQAYRTTDSKEIMSTYLVPFINNHYLTLNSLELVSYDYLDLCGILGALRHFPHLGRLKLCHLFATLRQTNMAGLQHFLELHAKSLRDLTLNTGIVEHVSFTPPPPDQWFQQGFLRVSLPGLQSLELGITDFILDVDRTSEYLKQYQSTITSLVLQTKAFSLQEISIIVDLFSGEDILHTLGIVVDEFSPTLLDTLSTRLPSLHNLEVEFNYFSHGLEQIDPSYISLEAPQLDFRFCYAMRGHRYPHWKLRYLDAFPYYRVPEDLNVYQDIIYEAIPNLDSLYIGFKGMKSYRNHTSAI